MRPSFYGKFYAQGYDIGTEETHITQFYLSQWKRLGKPGPVLEPMCGTGLKLIPFIQAGAVCDGLDASSHMLSVCQAKLDELNLKSELYHQNLEIMQLPKRYGFIFIPGGSIGHLYDKSIALQGLRRLKDHLLPESWLIFDVRPPAFMSVFGHHGLVDYDLVDYSDGSVDFTTGYWQHLEKERVIRKWNKIEHFVNNQLTQTEIFDYHERLYDITEMKTLLSEVGFGNIQTSKAYERNSQPVDKDGIVFYCINH